MRLAARFATVLLVTAPWVLSCAPGSDATGFQPGPGRPVYEARVHPDPEAGTLEATWTLRFLPRESGAGSMTFVLARGLEIQSLQGDGVVAFREEPTALFPGWREVVLELEDRGPDRPVTIRLTYAGGPALPDNRINQIAADWVELSVDSGWHPLFTGFDQPMRGTLELFLPGSWTVSAPGSATFESGRWVIRNDVPQLDVAFAAAPDLVRGFAERVSVLHRQVDAEQAAAVLEAGEACAAYLDGRYGAERPLPSTTLVLAERPGNAYARPGHIVLSRVDPADRRGITRFLCHELAHHWTLGADFTSAHHWMSEAFAEYVAARFVRLRFGTDAFRELVDQWEHAGRGHGPVWTAEMTGRGPDVLLYRKAPFLLARLEDRIGEEAFDRFLERFMTRDVATTQELLRHLEEVAGPETERWFRALLAAGPEARGGADRDAGPVDFGR